MIVIKTILWFSRFITQYTRWENGLGSTRRETSGKVPVVRSGPGECRTDSGIFCVTYKSDENCLFVLSINNRFGYNEGRVRDGIFFPCSLSSNSNDATKSFDPITPVILAHD